jgi:branched-chain amino acid transport system ATP-binding protein
MTAPLLDVSGLSKAFGGVHAARQVTFSLKRGELLALIGPNGAGKSTTFNMINGQLVPDAGSVKLDGEEIVGKPPRQIFRLGVGRTFQIAATFQSLTVLENVGIALQSHKSAINRFFARGLDGVQDEARALLDRVGMRDAEARAAGTLAYGDVKRLELAMALAGKPKLLLMDEPTAGMAPKERGELVALVRRIATEENIGVLFTEHSMDVVFAYAHRIIVLARGRLIAEGAPADVRANQAVKDVYFGSGATFELKAREAHR